jgi:hypothetical protein
VPSAIEQLYRADIRLFMLTGDKQETAESIGRAASLVREGMTVITVHGVRPKATQKALAARYADVQQWIKWRDNAAAKSEAEAAAWAAQPSPGAPTRAAPSPCACKCRTPADRDIALDGIYRQRGVPMNIPEAARGCRDQDPLCRARRARTARTSMKLEGKHNVQRLVRLLPCPHFSECGCGLLVRGGSLGSGQQDTTGGVFSTAKDREGDGWPQRVEWRVA